MNIDPQFINWDLRDAQGCGPTVINLGATIVSLAVPDSYGFVSNVALGLPSAEGYLADNSHLGCVAGRFANRIAGGRFSLDGQDYQLPVNNGANILHGGDGGFHKRLWTGERIAHPNGNSVRLSLISPDGDEGFPGGMFVSVCYIWTYDRRLIIEYDATTSKPTPFNITQHSYWNLGGADGNSAVLDHELSVLADAYLPVDSSLIPTGALCSVAGSPFDFRSKKPISQDIAVDDVQLHRGNGYDHCWALNGTGLRVVAELSHQGSGRCMTVETDQPGLQVYTGNALGNDCGDAVYRRHGGVALETQHFPDSPNWPHFPDTILRPGQRFKSTTIYSFSLL